MDEDDEHDDATENGETVVRSSICVVINMYIYLPVYLSENHNPLYVLYCIISVTGVDGSALLGRASELMLKVSDGSLSLDDALTSDVLPQLQDVTEQWKSSMSANRTAKLWIMYMQLVCILRSLIRSSRIGNWKLYLQSLREMLPYLCATGHNNYTKSLMLYLAKMENLEVTHPLVYSKFLEGLFVVHRSNTPWSGIFSDLCIEQVLMGSIKSSGGLTRGRGFEQSTSLLWLLSTPACGEVHKAVQEISGLGSSGPGTIHKDRTQARLSRDEKDLQSIMDYLGERKPFSKTKQELHSLSSGVIGETSVNVDNAEAVGVAIMASMEGKSVAEHKFTKKHQVVYLASSVYVSLDGEKIEIDPQQLYQRLLVAGIGSIELKTLFQYELCSYPTSLFDSKLFMRLADKADLQNALVKKVPSCVVGDQPRDLAHVIDGGAMLQRIPWPKSSSYGSLCHLYTRFICSHFTNSLIVFDGYGSGPSTKDETHQRRRGREMGVDVDVTGDMLLKMKKKSFLANPRNKQRFIDLLGSQLEKDGTNVKHSSGDADYDIVVNACMIAQTKDVVVVGDDTDLLILLLHHFNPVEHNKVYLQTSTKLLDISTLQKSLDPDLGATLLFIHGLTGCDTTSRPYGIGKVSAMANYGDLKDAAKQFMMPDRNQDDIQHAGCEAIGVLYGSKHGSDLNAERASKFSEKVASSSSYLPPERLPPTTDAAKFHSQRVYLQVQTWLGNSLDATKWGWEVCNTRYGAVLKPVRMEQVAAPASLLKIIKCNCTGKCDKNTCSCRKNRLLCGLACGHCKGITCTNGECHESCDSDSDTTDD